MSLNFSNEEIEYIKRKGGNISRMAKSEIKIIQRYYRLGNLNEIEFNRKGRLIFSQRHPFLPLGISIIGLINSIVALCLSWLKQ